MAAVKDIILENKDLFIKDGDFVVDFSSFQHSQVIINSSIGSFKQHPLCGVGVNSYIASSGQSQALKTQIITQLQADGFTDIDVIVNDIEKLEISISGNIYE
jgi:hypothetical protein